MRGSPSGESVDVAAPSRNAAKEFPATFREVESTAGDICGAAIQRHSTVIDSVLIVWAPVVIARLSLI